MLTPEVIWAQALSRPEAIALIVDGEEWSYDRLFGAAVALAKKLPGNKPTVGVFTARHISAYIAILGVTLAGGTYVPLNCRFPPVRNREIITRANIGHIVHGAQFESNIAEILYETNSVAIEVTLDSPPLSRTHWSPPSPEPTDTAYLLFTSGSTGVPKGVPISHGNLAAYLESVHAILKLQPDDRTSQTFDLTFDASVHDLFATWSAGATLCVASKEDLADPAKYIQRNQITQWFGVPSLAYAARKLGKLTENAFPSIRCSLFGGEALPSDLALEWIAATPNARFENWYGPTEATIACVRYSEAIDPELDIVPIGVVFPDITARIISADGKEVDEGEKGSLFIAGSQVAQRYFSDPVRTADSFVRLGDHPETFYDTGDIVSRKDGILQYYGRRDFQAKVRGYRVELEEVEAALRSQTNGKAVTALTWPHGAANATHIVAVVESDERDPNVYRKALASILPDYMVPSSIFSLSILPRNQNGKIDPGAVAKAVSGIVSMRQLEYDGSMRAKILELVLNVKPTLNVSQIETADSLLLAGLDSLDFVDLTLQFERELGIALTDERVAMLANMNFEELVLNLSTGPSPQADLNAMPLEQIAIANRTLGFLQQFPSVVRQSDQRLILAFGSSGTMRAIDSRVAEKLLRNKHEPLHVINAGLPMISLRTLVRISQFITETCQSRKIAGVLCELDPMHLSTVPPKVDIDLDESIFLHPFSIERRTDTASEQDWNWKLGGTLEISRLRRKAADTPLWQKARDHEVAGVYRGEIGFSLAAVDVWMNIIKNFQTLDVPILAWVHPLMQQQPTGQSFTNLIEKIHRSLGVQTILPSELPVKPELFLDLNHMMAGEGAGTLTNLLMAKLMPNLPN